MKILKLANGKTVVDDDVYIWASKNTWRINRDGYVVRKDKKSNSLFLHREIKSTPKDLFTDHINGDRLTNLRSNLRIVTTKENRYNTGIRRDNKSGYKGVWYRKDRKTFQAEIKKDGKKESLGCYKTAKEAAVVYNTRAKELFGPHARLNEI